VASRTQKITTYGFVLGGVAAITYAVQRHRNGASLRASSRVITIGKPPDQVERAWRDPTIREAVFAAMPRLAEHVALHGRPATPESWGTEVTISADPRSVAGGAGSIVPAVTRAVLLNLLHRFKALVETGEIPTLTNNPAGRHRIISAA
jgi:hypothetical protein